MDKLYCFFLIYLSVLFMIKSNFALSVESGYYENIDNNIVTKDGQHSGIEDVSSSGNGLDEDTSQIVDQDYAVLEPERGSAEFDLTPCQLLLIERQELGNLRVPQCTEDGKFVPRQCDVRTGECWCVDVYGKKLDKTTHQGSNKLDCSTSEIGRKSFDEDSAEKSILDEDFYGITVDKNKLPSGAVPSIDVDTESFNGDDLVQDEDIQDHKVLVSISQSRWHHLGVWAVIVIGAVITLLCLVLVAMCIVHQMRMKDEGSYTLCDEKKNMLPPFVKAPRRESIVYTRSQDNDECFT